MGVVWRAYDLELGRLVALKFMRGAALFDAGSVIRFRQEAQALARVQVPHVVQVFEYGADLQAPYIGMELLKGEDLGQRLKRLGRLSPVVAVEVVSQAANALQVAHAAGVVHRDLKPGNIFLAQVGGAEVVKLLDFGVAKLVDDTLDADATQTSELMGVPHYMSPEHTHSPKHVDGRTDLWALAVILYRALTGERPFDGESVADLIFNIRFAELVPPSRLDSSLPRGFDGFFAKALARPPDERFQTGEEFAVAAARALTEAAPQPHTSSARPRRGRVWAGVGLGLLLLPALAIGGVAVLEPSPSAAGTPLASGAATASAEPPPLEALAPAGESPAAPVPSASALPKPMPLGTLVKVPRKSAPQATTHPASAGPVRLKVDY